MRVFYHFATAARQLKIYSKILPRVTLHSKFFLSISGKFYKKTLDAQNIRSITNTFVNYINDDPTGYTDIANYVQFQGFTVRSVDKLLAYFDCTPLLLLLL